jgi:hypothetical protein
MIAISNVWNVVSSALKINRTILNKLAKLIAIHQGLENQD